jgi:ADP-ribose pyrophosphatase YjhB (NUDIX family)
MRYVFRISQARFTAGVVGVVLNDSGQILVVEHRFHPEMPWGLPGGWLNAGESPANALRRELQEETNLSLRVLIPLAVESGYYSKSHMDIAYLCHSQQSVIRLNGELSSYRWVAPEEMPRLLPFHQVAVKAAIEFRLKQEVYAS